MGYSQEELVAEMGSAFLCGHCGILTETETNSAAYLKHWLEQLKADHHRTVSQNTPVMRRLLSEYFDQLESLVLNDSQCGILQTLDRVRRMVAEQYKGP
jgi:antirestriction protein ArdC